MVLADSFYYQPVQIDTINTRVNADLFAKEGDANGRGMVVQITENGMIKDTTGITLRLQWSHIRVGVSGFTDFEIVDATKGLYKLIYPTSMLHRGRVEAFIRITDNGTLSGTRNLLITVERMVGSDETIEASDDFSALQSALTKLSAWEAVISGKVDTWEADMEATKQLYIDTLAATEAGYPQELVSLKSELAEKVTKGLIRSVDLDTSSDSYKIKPINVSDELMTMFSPSGTVSPVVPHGSLTQEKYAPKSITPLTTNFLEPGKNLFDKNTAIPGYKLNFSGQPEVNANYYLSAYMKCLPNTTCSRKAPYLTSFYDSSFVHISTINGQTTYTTPANTAYKRIDVYKSALNAEQVEVGVSTSYENYGIKLKSLLNKSVPKSALDDLARKDSYPFLETATFDNAEKEPIVRNAIKRIDLNNANPNKKYFIYILQKNFSTYGTSVNICEANVDGTVLKSVATGTKLAYTHPTGIDVFPLFEANASGMSGNVWIDWSAIADNTQYVFNNYAKSALDLRTMVLPTDEARIILPPTIPALVGKEVNIYFDNIIMADNPSVYSVEVDCAIGKQQNERWTCVPTVAGTSALTMKLFKNGKPVGVATTSVIVKDTTVGNGINKKLICIGDSTTDVGTYTGELLNLFGASDVMDITLMGTRGTAPNSHEGRAGWKASNYVVNASVLGVENAFWNPNTSAFDFSYYMTQQGYAGVDYVGIHLGINDVFSCANDAEMIAEIPLVLGRFDAMLNSVKSYNATIKVAFMVTIPPAKNQDAFGTNYRNGQSKWRYKRNNQMLVEALIAEYRDREAEGIYLIPLNVNLDTENNMQTETVVVNSRNTATKVRQNNGVHPANSGYYQMSDMIYYWLKGQEI